MTIFAVRIFIFTLLPVLAAAVIARLDSGVDSRQRRLEVYLVYLFGLGVAGSGIGGFFGHLFLSDVVAESVGWEAGSPFQLEMGFANLALGMLGLVAASRRDGFREATVIAVTVIGFGATVVHVIDIVQTGNLAPGNTLQNVANLAKPLLLIGFLRASRRAEGTSSPGGSDGYAAWHARQVQAVGWMTGMVASGFGLGFALGWPVIGTAVGVAGGAAAVWLALGNSRSAVGRRTGA